MQRIYPEGMSELESAIPSDWAHPMLLVNYRSAKRIVALANKMSACAGRPAQSARPEAEIGTIRCILAPSGEDHHGVESQVCEAMNRGGSRLRWSVQNRNFQVLLLEHRMASVRFGFSDFFAPLWDKKVLDRDALRSGEFEEYRFLEAAVAIWESLRNEDRMQATRQILNLYGLRNMSETIGKSGFKPILKNARQLEDTLRKRQEQHSDSDMKLIDLVLTCRDAEVELPEDLAQATRRDENVSDETSENVLAWREALRCSVEGLRRYSEYCYGNTNYTTHHGVKGAEFENVMFVLDDDGARGKSHKYLKTLQSAAAAAPGRAGASLEKQHLSTLRLLYVTCTRARSSLALVIYSRDCDATKRQIQDLGWFEEEEIVRLKS